MTAWEGSRGEEVPSHWRENHGSSRLSEWVGCKGLLSGLQWAVMGWLLSRAAKDWVILVASQLLHMTFLSLAASVPALTQSLPPPLALITDGMGTSGGCLKITLTHTHTPGSSPIFFSTAGFLKGTTWDLSLFELRKYSGQLRKCPVMTHFQVESQGAGTCDST